MKKIFGILLMVSAWSAVANDSGAYMINVKGVDPENGQSGDGYVAAKSGTTFLFRGPEATNFAKKLPPITSVTPTTDKYFRALHMVSGGWELVLSCDTAGYGESGVVPWENYAECAIRLSSLGELGSPDADLSSFKELEFAPSDADRNVQSIGVDLIQNQRPVNGDIPAGPEAKSGTRITFYGKDVEQFLRIMPDSKKYTINGKGAGADGYDNKLVFTCVKAKESRNSSCAIEYTEKQWPRL